MSDDRDFSQYRHEAPRNITFQEYVRRIVEQKRTEEMDQLVRLFGVEAMEAVLEGKRQFTHVEFVTWAGGKS